MKTFVYDIPTRLFHWLFAFLFLISFIIAKLVDDGSMVFICHMFSGFLLMGLALWRIIWSIIGSQYSKFSSLELAPKELKNYFLGTLKGSDKRWIGHNPASSWILVITIILALALGLTGYGMVSGYKHELEDFHELLANIFIIVVILHIAGIVVHSIRFRDRIALSMISGYKNINSPDEKIKRSGKPIAALILFAIFSYSTFSLFKNFDSNTKHLNLLGTNIKLGKSHDHKKQNKIKKNKEKENKMKKNKVKKR